jgi:hypothetical protein
MASKSFKIAILAILNVSSILSALAALQSGHILLKKNVRLYKNLFGKSRVNKVRKELEEEVPKRQKHDSRISIEFSRYARFRIDNIKTFRHSAEDKVFKNKLIYLDSKNLIVRKVVKKMRWATLAVRFVSSVHSFCREPSKSRSGHG